MYEFKVRFQEKKNLRKFFKLKKGGWHVRVITPLGSMRELDRAPLVDAYHYNRNTAVRIAMQ